jgi:hypothetical protein
MLKKIGFGVLLVCIIVLVLPVLGQDAPEVVASGLNNPRHLFYAADGTLYIAEAGVGGETSAPSPQGGGEVLIGLSSQVSIVNADGEQSVLLPELLSTDVGFGQVYGVGAVYVSGNSLWIVTGQAPIPDDMPEGFDAPIYALAEYDLETLELIQAIDLYSFEQENNPDGADDHASNPVDLAVAEDGTVYIVDASGNSVITWTEVDGLQLFASWEPDPTFETPAPVPTSVAIGPDNDIYVGFLTGFPFLPEVSRIERLSPEGELVETYEGLTLVTDVAFGSDGALYAVQFASGFVDTGFIPNSGSIVMVSDEGITPVMEGLNLPYGLAQDADGNWVVSINSAFSAPGSGEVIQVVAGMNIASEPAVTPEPAATPDA